MPIVHANNDSTIRFSEIDFKKDEDALSFLLHAVQEKEDFNSIRERQAEINRAWYMGHQELLWDRYTNRLMRVPNSQKRVRLVFNTIQPAIDVVAAKIGADEIHFEVVPATEDISDYDRARLATRVLGGYYDSVLDMQTIVEENDRWMLLAGESYVRVCWDSTKGSEFQFSSDDVAMDEDAYKEKYGDGRITIGELDVSVVFMPNIFWGPWGSRFDDAEWVLELTERSRGYVSERYDVPLEELESEYPSDRMKVWRPSEMGPLGDLDAREDTGDTVIVKSLWVRACKKYPKGWHVVAVGNNVLENKENPYDHGQIPYVAFRDILVPGRASGQSRIDNMLAPQSDINRSMSQQVENRELMANPFVLARDASIKNLAQWNSRPGGIRFYLGDVPPMVIPGQGMPSTVLIQLQKTEKFLQDVVGARDVSQAKVPTGVKSGIAIRALQEADDTRLAPLIRRRRKAWQRVGQFMLRTIRQFVKEDRLVKILGDENEWESVRFTGDDLVGPSGGPGVNYYDVRVRTTGLPMSRIAQMEMLNNLLQYKVLDPATDQTHRRIVMEMLDMGDTITNIDPWRKDKNQARRENETMARGQYMDPRNFDNHEIHLYEHQLYQKSDWFRQLPPQIQALYEYHRQRHIEEMAKKTMLDQQIVARVAAQFGPPPAPAQPTNGEMTGQNGPQRMLT